MQILTESDIRKSAKAAIAAKAQELTEAASSWADARWHDLFYAKQAEWEAEFDKISDANLQVQQERDEAKRQLAVLESSNKQLVEQVRILRETAGSTQEAA